VAEREGIEGKWLINGDDVIGVVNRGRDFRRDDFLAIGFDIDIVHRQELGDVGFCKMYFAETTSGIFRVTDPLTPLSKHWASRQYLQASEGTLGALALLRGVSLLYLYEAPVVTAYARCLVRIHGRWERRLSKVVKAMRADQHEKEKLMSAIASDWKLRLEPVIPGEVYEAVERIFGLPVAVQRELETRFDACEGELDVRFLEAYIPRDWQLMWHDNVIVSSKPLVLSEPYVVDPTRDAWRMRRRVPLPAWVAQYRAANLEVRARNAHF